MNTSQPDPAAAPGVATHSGSFPGASVLAPLHESMMETLRRDYHRDLLVMLHERVPKVVLVLLLLFGMWRIALFFVHRMRQRADRQATNSLRAAQLRTMAAIVRGTALSVFAFLAFLQVLNLFNINYAPLLASAGILGVGIGLAAQSLFKDMINGTFILVEDQYNVGENVTLASVSGTVEDLTLRTTRIRGFDGTLHIIPNSQIATVSNLSRDYAVATLPVTVDGSVNPDRMIALLRALAEEIRKDPDFRDIFIQDVNVLGVDRIEGRSITYPVLIRVRPAQRDAVLRELRRRVLLAFERDGIPLGSDPTMLAQPKPDPTAPPNQPVL